MVGGEEASHSFLLLLDKPKAIVGGEQSVFFVAVVDVKVLDTFFQCP